MFFIVFGIKDYLAEVFHGLIYFPCAQFIGSACRNISSIGGIFQGFEQDRYRMRTRYILMSELPPP
ncbi:MAG: hypothetical protein PWQ69_1230 [Methanomicrobiaceae archaeon]|nr:hypothetical protein [Methanomicrobiaceae archaeon]